MRFKGVIVPLFLFLWMLTAIPPDSHAHFSSSAAETTSSLITSSFAPAYSQPGDDIDEVFLEFRYLSLVNTFITGYYTGDTFYLPLSGLLSVLQVDYNWDAAERKFHGFYITEDRRYSLDLSDLTITLDGKKYQITPDQILIRDTDFYITTDLFRKVFGLGFDINFQRMTLSLTTPDILPVEQVYQRGRNRKITGTSSQRQHHHDLRFDREKSSLDGMFLDYNIAWNRSRLNENRSARFGYGAELLGGDIQGYFSLFDNGSVTRYENRDIRWRYAFSNPAISYIAAGELYSRGLASNAFYGVQVSNDPIEPRRYFGDYQIRGFAGPGHDVELFVNGRLSSYMQADESGNYQFSLPVTYGSALVNIRNYGPSGSFSEESRRVNVPSTLLRPGEFTYHADAGWLNRIPVRAGFSNGDFMTQGSAGFGVSENLTMRGGIEYFGNTSAIPVISGSATARILDQYIVNTDLVPGHFYRLAGNVQYPGFTSLQVSSTVWNSSSMYNYGRIRSEMQGSLFLPVFRTGLPLSLRLSGSRTDFGSQSVYQIDTGVMARLHRLNLQAGYRETLFNRSGSTIRQNRIATGSIFYMFENRALVPLPLRTLMVRAQLRYLVNDSKFESVTLTADRRVGRFGRVSAGVERNYARHGDFLFLSLTFDFPQVRTSGNYRSGRNDFHMMNQIHGSAGYDSGFNRVLLDSRHNVGQSGAAIRMLVMEDDESGNTVTNSLIIPADAIRFRQTTRSRIHSDGVNRVSQLIPYTRYSIDILTDKIKNPLLIPEFTGFSFVTDPNGFKKIDIPLIMSGEVDGIVRIEQANGDVTGTNGLRVVMTDKNRGTREVLPAFADGSFYKLGVRPGHYIITPDSMQLEMLGMVADPPSISFELEARAEGDYAENLNFTLRKMTEPQDQRLYSDNTGISDDADTGFGSDLDIGYLLVLFAGNSVRADSVNTLAALHNSKIMAVKPGTVVELSGLPISAEYRYPASETEAGSNSISDSDTVSGSAPDSSPENEPEIVSGAVKLTDSALMWYRTLELAAMYMDQGTDPAYIRLNYRSEPVKLTAEHGSLHYNSAVLTEDLTSLHPVIFGLNSSVISPSYQALLDENIKLFHTHPDAVILIQALADDIGNPVYNQALTSRRAENVRNYYISRGIPADRVMAESLGITGSPCVIQDETTGCSVNRRADSLLMIPPTSW